MNFLNVSVSSFAKITLASFSVSDNLLNISSTDLLSSYNDSPFIPLKTET